MDKVAVGLTSAERELVLMLGKVWDGFLGLPVEHPMDQAEMCTLIHRAQEKILGRVGRRCF